MQFVKNKFRKKYYKLNYKISFSFNRNLGIVFLLNKIDFPAPKKQIEK